MRVSADKTDRGYGPVVNRIKMVWLDGKPVKLPITADEERGFVLAYALDEKNNVLVDFDGELVRELLRGRVRIELVH